MLFYTYTMPLYINTRRSARTWWRLLQKRAVHTKLDIYVFVFTFITVYNTPPRYNWNLLKVALNTINQPSRLEQY
jgi:hypothetical protein